MAFKVDEMTKTRELPTAEDPGEFVDSFEGLPLGR